MQMDSNTKENNAKIIGQRINSALAKANKMQKDLAAHLGVTDNTVSYYCSGSRTPNTMQIIEIANFLSVSTDYLLGLSDIQTSNIDKKEICRRLHIPDEMYDILRKLFLDVSPYAYIEYLEDDLYVDSGDPLYRLKKKQLERASEKCADNKDKKIALKYFVIRKLLENDNLIDKIASTVYYSVRAKHKSIEAEQMENEVLSLLNLGDEFTQEEAETRILKRRATALCAVTKNSDVIIKQKEDARILFDLDTAETLADAKELRVQKHISSLIAQIVDEIKEEYYFENGNMYAYVNNELVEEDII